jgi:galactokinase
MDQLASAAGVAGHALMIDCATLQITPVPVPQEVDVVVLHSGHERRLSGSAYAERRAQCEATEAIIGPLRLATLSDAEGLRDPLMRRRARHVISENHRVRAFAEALSRGDLAAAGGLMVESHTSLRDDFEVSTPALDRLVERLLSTPGVLGARLTGAGFGGCVVALAGQATPIDGQHVRPAAGAVSG